MAILVTGGTKGIGKDIAIAFAEPGNRVFLNYLNDAETAERTQEAVIERGAHCHLIQADVGSPDGAAHCMKMVSAHTDHLDQLVHCAVHVIAEPALEVDPDAFTKAINLNGNALLYLVQAALPLMQQGSSVFYLSSRGSHRVIPNYAAVGAGKALGEMLIRYLAKELAPRGIRANVVAPSIVETDAIRTIWKDKTDRVMRNAAKHNPSGRGIHSADYCELIRFLASPEAAYIQGQIITVDGGDAL